MLTQGPESTNATFSVRKVCSNCETTVASSWRRDKDGRPMCNSCSVYQRMYGIARPKDMRKDKVAPRSAAPTADAQPRKRNRRTAVKRVRPVPVPQSTVFANGAEEYT
ncbi:hypothetical protein HDU99_000973, partial [Rhizoclosmatium hyalinum]